MFSTIGTHSGSFHCDEALACFMLRVLNPDAAITRSRDAEVLKDLDIIVDVGGVYDPSTHRYDHHQRGFTEVFDNDHSIKLSSAGLVYKHFGRDVLAALAPELKDEKDQELLYMQVYDGFMAAIDGIDNGVSQYPTDIEPVYTIPTDLSARVSYLNPGWNEKNVTDADRDERFKKAVALTGNEFTDYVRSKVERWFPAREIVKAALLESKEHDNSGEIMVLKDYCSWQSHLSSLEEELKTEKIKYVLYPDSSGKWRIQCVPEAPKSFVSRLPMPEPWRGIRDQALSDLTGIPGCVFVHAAGFIGGNETFDGVLEMARQSLKTAGEPAPKRQKV